MAINILLKQKTLEGDIASFYVQFSNGQEKNYRFPVEGFVISQLIDAVIADLTRLNSIQTKFDAIDAFVGKTFELVNGQLKEVK
jgi:hypothetical protein